MMGVVFGLTANPKKCNAWKKTWLVLQTKVAWLYYFVLFACSIHWLKARKGLRLEIGKCLIVATAVCFIKLQTIMIEMVFAVMKSSPHNPLTSRVAFNRIVCRLSSFLCIADS